MKAKKRFKSIYCPLGASKEHSCAYCRLHKMNMSLKQIKKKECLAKQCKWLKRLTEHPYWAQREAIKIIRKEHSL